MSLDRGGTGRVCVDASDWHRNQMHSRHAAGHGGRTFKRDKRKGQGSEVHVQGECQQLSKGQHVWNSPLTADILTCQSRNSTGVNNNINDGPIQSVSGKPCQ